MKNSKKGFTLVECVVAMAVITLVSAMALSVMQTTLGATNNQWNDFRVTQTANNILTVFQGSDDLVSFESHLPLEAVGDSILDSVTVQTSAGTYKQLDAATAKLPIPFTAVRAYETGLVEFYNHTLVSGTDYGDAILTLSYADNLAAYLFDVRGTAAQNPDSVEASGKYDAGVPHNESLGYDAFTVTGRFTTWMLGTIQYDETYSADVETGVSFSLVKDSPTEDYSKSYSTVLSPLEKYLLDKGWYLQYDNNSIQTVGTVSHQHKYSGLSGGGYYWYSTTAECFNANNTAMYLFVYDIRTQSPVTNGSGKNLYLCIECHQNTKAGSKLATANDAPLGGRTRIIDCDYAYDWDSDDAYFDVSSVKYLYASALDTDESHYTALTDDNGNGFAFRWWGLPSLIWDRKFDSERFCTTTGVTSTPSAPELYYTDYALASGHDANLLSALTDYSTFVRFQNSTETLYRYSGDAVPSVISSQLNSRLSFVDHGAYEGSTNAVFYRTAQDAVICSVIFDDGAHQIIFRNSSNLPVITFTYTQPQTYNSDKHDITNPNGAYNANFTELVSSFALKTPNKVLLRVGKDTGGHGFYQMVLSDGTTEALLFIAYADGILIENGAVNTERDFEQVVAKTEDQTYESATKYYCYRSGKYACLAKVTFSQYYGETEVEPCVSIWLMSNDELNRWLEANGGSVPTPPADTPFISYRKG